MLTILLTLLTEPISLLLSLLHPRFKRDHFAPHPTAPFEGYYTRILTPEATILLILSSVRKAKHKPHHLHFSYLPHPTSPFNGENHRIDLFPTITDQLLPLTTGSKVQPFRGIVSDGIGEYTITPEKQTYSLRLPGGVEVDVQLTERTPWHKGDELSSPEGALAELVHLLPIHWNVFSIDSRAEYRISIPGRRGQQQEEISGIGRAHIEKNWGVAFPSGWTWVQAFPPPLTNPTTTPSESSPPSNQDPGFKLCLAGGQTLFQKAYLLSYTSPTTTLRFTPPFSLLPFTLSTPFCSEEIDSRAGLFKLSVANFTHKIVLTVKGPEMHRGWVGLHCPLSSGHGNVYAYETFEGVIEVCVFKRELGGWWGYKWTEVERRRMGGCALEFGGGYSFKVRAEGGKFD
ncbi:hypothetical protein L873DRAFT_1703968 [Choiromyces venosus 120613-1]|uniref:Uncharacterized protein n=1 Tax=Choiromyces venosus 120613-1 TaxID=1336337 RepID=A0A3N4JIR4_9PEZI|nr:hypothetical protein L873DRAFT_1703968 [Choiromyces venosus 120613-1]